MKKLVFFFSILSILFLQCQSQSKTAKKINGPFEVMEIKNLSYVKNPSPKTDSLQQLNLFLPKGAKKVPLLIWIGGGAWSYVNRHMETDLAHKLVKDGIAVASVGHRLSTAVWRDSSMNEGIQHPEHIRDIAAAFQWLVANKKQYNYNIDKIVIGGFSSGAHLATLISMNEKYLKEQGLSKDMIKGVIAFGGTYDIPDYYDAFVNGSNPQLAETHVQAVFGKTEEAFLDASPTTFLKDLKAPLLLMSENNTNRYAELFRDKILATDYKKMEFHHADMGHGELWQHISKEEKSEYRDMMVDFILRSCGKG